MRFDVCAHTYDEHAGPQRFFAERVAQFILRSGTGILPVRLRDQISNTSPDRQDACPTTILELGAGTGALTRWLARARSAAEQPTPYPSQEGNALSGADRSISPAASECPGSVPLQGGARGGSAGRTEPPFLATDASPAMVQFGSLAVPQADWAVLDAFNQLLPVADLQVSSGLLHWTDDPVAMLQRWKISLPPGGRMIHAMPCEPCLAEWRALVPESPVPWRSESEWLKFFEQAGLRVTRSQSWTHAAVCSSALEMVRGFHRTGVTGRVRVGPARLRQALRDYDLRQRVPGGVKATWAWLAVEATHG